jgi:ferric-dicitrate binding protein FerR (iron transport regulator)
MQVDERSPDHPDEELIRRAVRGELDPNDKTALDQHLTGCATCAAELEARRIFQVSLTRDALDDARDSEAVERTMARIGERSAFDAIASGMGEEALNRVAIDRAMSRLDEREARSRGGRRHVRATMGFAALGAAAAAIVFGVLRTPATTTTATTTTSAAFVRPVVLTDGSEIVPETATTPIQIAEETPVRTTVRLPAGAARFSVRHDVRRLFRVDAGSFEIEDLGTVFRVAHEAEGRVRVTVSEGRVAVVSAASRLRVELGAGEDRVFSPTAEPRDVLEQPVEAPKLTAAPLSTKSTIRGPSRAQGGDDPAGLLSAADVARRSHSPRDAVAPLRRLIDRYPKDPRAPSAAFTLGWVLLTDLNRPRDAAVAFADAERIAPRGALAEDAAARVAEAWQKAGEPRRAAAAARHYAQMYPSGRYIVLMRGLIGEN